MSNIHAVYKDALKLPSEQALKAEANQSKEESDWFAWREQAQSKVFISRLREAQRKLDTAAKILATNGDEKQLRAVLTESLTIDKVINITTKGIYASQHQES